MPLIPFHSFARIVPHSEQRAKICLKQGPHLIKDKDRNDTFNGAHSSRRLIETLSYRQDACWVSVYDDGGYKEKLSIVSLFFFVKKSDHVQQWKKIVFFISDFHTNMKVVFSFG